MKKDDSVFLKHILDNIEKIENFSKKISKKDFYGNELKQYAIIRAIEVIGEAVKNLSTEFKKENKGIPWKEIAGARDKIIHHYFGIDLDIIWDIVKINLPHLKEKIKHLIN